MEVLKSKSFWSSVATVIALFVVAIFPEFAPVREELISAIGGLGLALVAGHKGKDVLISLIEALVTRTAIQDHLGDTEETPVTIS